MDQFRDRKKDEIRGGKITILARDSTIQPFAYHCTCAYRQYPINGTTRSSEQRRYFTRSRPRLRRHAANSFSESATPPRALYSYFFAIQFVVILTTVLTLLRVPTKIYVLINFSASILPRVHDSVLDRNNYACNPGLCFFTYLLPHHPLL
jgi:hypothetical protein